MNSTPLWVGGKLAYGILQTVHCLKLFQKEVERIETGSGTRALATENKPLGPM